MRRGGGVRERVRGEEGKIQGVMQEGDMRGEGVS